MLRMLCFLIAIYGALFSTCYADPFTHKEEIANFLSVITINPDTTVDITEKITVYANQGEIKSGITRHLPVIYHDMHGQRKLQYQVFRVLLNNEPVDFHTQMLDQQFIIAIGDPYTPLPPRTYTYTIQYRVMNAISFLKDKDEFRWNVTGNEWNLAIMGVADEINLPVNTPITSVSGHTGKVDAVEKHFTVAQPAPNRITLQTTRALKAGEGLTISIFWPKGTLEKLVPKKTHAQIETKTLWLIILEILLMGVVIYLVWRVLRLFIR